MKKSLITIFIIIVAVHVAALIILLWQKNANVDEGESDSAPIQVPEPTINQKASATLRTSAKKNLRKVLPKTSEKLPAGSLIFKNTVFGNIKTIPQSKFIKAGILVDANSRKVLWSKNSKKVVPIASMTKIMTVLLVMEAIKNGEISVSTPIKVTKKAASIGGCDVWLDSRETFPLQELLKAIVIKSANDAAYLVAEYLGDGNVSNFVKKMNAKAEKMGMKATHFLNPNGLPEKNNKQNVSSCEDMVYMAKAFLQYPAAMKLSSTKYAVMKRKIGKHKETKLYSTNKLLRTNCPGVDGMKTGFTNKAGFCITLTCKRDKRRMIAVLTGCPSSKVRNAFARKLLDWGYSK